MGCAPLFEISSTSATHVNTIKLNKYHQLGCYNHYQFPTRFGLRLQYGLPLSQGRNVIMVVVDGLSKYAHFISLSHPYTATAVAHLFINHMFKLRGMPISIVCDGDPAFTSSFWQELFRLQATRFIKSQIHIPPPNRWPM